MSNGLATIAAIAIALITTSAPAQIPATWLNPVSGDWSNADYWSTLLAPNNGYPNPADTYDVTLNPFSGYHYYYSIGLSNDVVLDHLALNDQYLTFLQAGDSHLTAINGLTITNSLYKLSDNPTIRDTTITGTNGDIFVAPGATATLDNITLERLFRVGPSGIVQVDNGLIMDGGTLLIQGYSYYDGSIPYSQAIVSDGAPISGTGRIIFSESYTQLSAQSGPLILGPGIQVAATTSGRAYIGDDNVSLVQFQGSLTNDIEGRDFWLSGQMFHNEGTMAVSNGTLSIRSDSFVNVNTINISGGTTSLNNSWSNAGIINLSGGVLRLGGNFSMTDVGTINKTGGTIQFGTATLDNTGMVFVLPHDWDWTYGGFVNGGIVRFSDDGTDHLPYVGLQDASMEGNLTLQAWEIKGNVTLNGNSISMDKLSTGSATIDFSEHGQLSGNADIVVQNTASATIQGDSLDPGIIGSGINVLVKSTNAKLLSVTNRGNLMFDVPATVSMEGNWRNEGAIEMSGGVLKLGGEFAFDDYGQISRNGASVQIVGKLVNTGQTLALNEQTGSWILNGGTILGGNISNTGGESLLIDHGTLDGVRLAGDVLMDSSSSLSILHNLTLVDSDLLLRNSSYGDVTLYMYDGSAIKGTGTIVFDKGSGTIEPYVQRFTIDPGITVKADGGLVTMEDFINKGTIIVDNENSYIALDGNWTNQGLIRAAAGKIILRGDLHASDLGQIDGTGGTIYLGGTLDNVGNVLTAAQPTEIWIVGAQITGGALQSLNDASFELDNPTLTDVSLQGAFTGRGFVLHNQLTVLPDTHITIGNMIKVEGETRITGNGIIDCLNASSISMQTASSLTIDDGIIIRSQSGAPTIIGGNNDIHTTFINHGTLWMDSPSKTFSIKGLVDWSNEGVMRVTQGTLDLGGYVTTRGLGQIEHQGGIVKFSGYLDNTNDSFDLNGISSTWDLGGTIIGGTINAVGGEAIVDSLSTMSDVALAEGLSLRITNSLKFENGLTVNNNHIVLDSSNKVASLSFKSSSEIAGNLEIVMDGQKGSEILGSPVFGPGVTIRTGTGGGRIGNTNAWVNKGLISVETEGTALLLGGAWRNEGILRVSAGTLSLDGELSTANLGHVEHTGGTLEVLATLTNTSRDLDLDTVGGSWIFSGTLLGGKVTSTEGSILSTSTAPIRTARFNDVVLDVDLSVQPQNRRTTAVIFLNLTLEEGHTIQNRDHVEFGSKYDTSTQHLAGKGEFVFNGGTAEAWTFVVDEGMTLSSIGDGTFESKQFTNDGLISARNASDLTIDASTGWTNNHDMEAAGGNLILEGAGLNQASIVARNGGFVTLMNTGTNNGLIQAVDGGGIKWYTTWDNQGQIRLNNAEFHLMGTVDLDADYGDFQQIDSRTVIAGTLDNTGQTLEIHPLLGELSLGKGTITGGAIGQDYSTLSPFKVVAVGAKMTDVQIQGAVQVLKDATLYPLGAWSNDGSIAIQGGHVYCNEPLTTSQLGSINIADDGSITFGDLDNTASDLLMNGGKWFLRSGTLTGGIVHAQSEAALYITRLTSSKPNNTIDGSNLYTDLYLTTGSNLSLIGSWQMHGTIHDGNGTITLGGQFTTSNMGTFDSPLAHILISGTLDNRNDELILTGNSAASWTLQGGEIIGGRISSPTGKTLQINAKAVNKLTGVTLAATTNLVSNSSSATSELQISGGLTLDNASLDVLSSKTPIRLIGSQIIAGNGSILLDTEYSYYGAGRMIVEGDLTLAPDITLQVYNGATLLADAFNLTNYGFMMVGGSSSLVTADFLANYGTIKGFGYGTSNLHVNRLLNRGSLLLNSTTAVISATDFTNQYGGLIDGDGTIQLDDDSLLTNSGTINVHGSSSSHALRITGDFRQTSVGQLQLQLYTYRNTDIAQQLQVSGDADLNGSLTLSFIEESRYFPLGTFTILTADSITGEFSDVQLDTPDWLHLDFAMDYSPQAVTVQLSNLDLTTDVNGDGLVDVLDLGILAGQWQTTGENLAADANHDGIVDTLDLALLSATWRKSPADYINPDAAGSSIPEPTSLVFLFLAAASCTRRKP